MPGSTATAIRRDDARAAGTPARRRHPPLERLAVSWQRALDSAQRALADGPLPGNERGARLRALDTERAETAALLARVARTAGVEPVPWLAPFPVAPPLLGLPSTVRACVFDLERVLSDSGVLHADAWATVFDRFLLEHAARTGWRFVPFERWSDYVDYLEGRPRLDGIQAFLHSRGIELPLGSPDDASTEATVYGLARSKNEVLAQLLRRRRVVAAADARPYLEAAGRAGLGRSVVSASAHTARMLDLAGLASVVDARVDADVIHEERLRARPEPDALVAACRRLGVASTDSALFTSMPAGVVAGREGGLYVIGVGDGADAELLARRGAHRVVPSLGALLDTRLRGVAERARSGRP